MDIHRLGLIDSLLKIIDQNDMGNPDHAIAKYFLENYDRIGTLNIYDVAAECYVSRSSIRRFCKQIGYENFLELKKEFQRFDYQYNYFMYFVNEHKGIEFRDFYQKEMAEMLSEINELFPEQVIHDIISRLHRSEQVVFLSSYSPLPSIREFQRPLVLLNKMIRVIEENNIDEEELKSLGKQDAVFVISATGFFAQTHLSMLDQIIAYKALFTTSHDNRFAGIFDDVYHLSKHDYTNRKNLKGKYGLQYLLDILYNAYVDLYG